MTILTESILLVGSLIVLAYASEFVLRYSINIANATKIGELVFGFVILSLLTNLPELSVATTSIVTNNQNISIGNLVGGSVFKTTFAVGLMALLATLWIRKDSLKQLSRLLFFVVTISLLVVITEIPTKIFGGLLILFYIGFIWISIKGKLNLKELRTRKFRENFKSSWILGFLVSVAIVIGSGIITVRSTINLSSLLGISQTIIGATIIGISTNIPELTIAIRSVLSKHASLGIGNILGSNLGDIALILGLVFLLSPTISLDRAAYSTVAVYLLGVSLALWIFFGRGKLEKPEGILLISLFIIFVLVSFGFSLGQLRIIS